MRIILVFLMLLSSSQLFAQFDSLSMHVNLYGAAGSEGFPPHWIVSNRNGIFSDDSNDLLIMPGFEDPIYLGKKWLIETGFDAVIKYDIDQSFIYQGYVNVNYGKFKLMMGRQEYTLGQYDEDISSGSFLISNNAKPIPRIGLGFYDYVEVPFTKGWLYVKGGLNHGWLDNDRLHHSPINKPLLHEKFAYIKTGNIPLNPHVGLAHVALYGGERSNGNKVGVDYWSVFFGKGSSAANNLGEEVNAIGEHLGILDIGLNSSVLGYDFTVYYQFPITSSTGFVGNFSRNDDFIFGVLLRTEKKSILSGFTYEWVRTVIQGDIGIPDPVIGGRFIDPSNPADQEYLRDYYSARGYVVDGITTDLEWLKFLEAYENFGYTYGGREDYYNNYLYTYVYNDRIIGTSLFHTQPQILRMAGEDVPDRYIVNNRILGHQFGFQGWIFDRLQYRFLLTFSRNRGAWQEYGGRGNWEGIILDPDFEWYWKGDKDQFYSLIEFNYEPSFIDNFNFTLGVGSDFGEIYSNFGVIGGVKYQFGLKK